MPAYDASSPDPDGDGVEGLDDAYPNDPSARSTSGNAFRRLEHDRLRGQITFVGDGDYNDVVANWLEQVMALTA
ncbi:MAG: hypothetical protein R3B99_35230 [Polyangiales bacterium]